MKIWFNNKLMNPSADVLTTAGWPRGSGIFETIKTVEGRPQALSRHMRRATTSAQRLGVPMPTEDLIRSAIEAVMDANPFISGRLRLSFSEDGNFVATHESYHEENSTISLGKYIEPINIDGIPIKTFPYTHRLEILRKANLQGFGEAVICNSKGQVTEGAVSNLIFEIQDQWVTPPIAHGVLPGVMRALVVEYLDVKVDTIVENDLHRTTGAVVISSLKIARAVHEIDGIALPETTRAEQLCLEIREMARATSLG